MPHVIRRKLKASLYRWREAIAALLVMLIGLWVLSWGGWFYALLGALAALIGVALLLGAWRRLPFLRDIAAPGYVQLDEGAIRYYGARILGGEIALRDLTQIKLMPLQGRAHWRLKSRTGEALLVPVDAAGAEVLADAFAALPGLDMAALSAALSRAGEDGFAARTLWRRPD